ncbi:heparan-alpha-glucosaminide N-acetyltransferase domain-containing protein [Arthrobacter sp. zg-Y1219]|uniref:heparan-alpha-glucosaminide N-acetyltransferase domain-containing protein n=1 Tax=Arthrobacter sp. zg-Y1219 TaxID=3049067 RepID=UPI0024C28F28|nr:heparan-alpha-glucosaminide N-acetyltransferase domain-containing protein [Arthrobacter sp. zg-Y1219]MDK1360367.1 heparan-alpha-glucosaminide N-acetyltransferase domain-containing protein [Arthrobacter sp. zg-Y1219]
MIGRRLTGIDAARGVALLGMMATHIFPLYDEQTGEPSWVGLVFSGRSSALFAVVAGIGLALLTGGSQPRSGRALSADRRGIAMRALIIALVGLALGGLETSIAVILFHYGILFLLALPFVGMRLPKLALWAVVWLLLSPVLAYLVRPWIYAAIDPSTLDTNITWESFLQPATLLVDVLFTGFYPALQWLSYLLIGMVIGRLRLGEITAQVGLVAAGIVAAAGAKFLSYYLLFDRGGLAALEETASGRLWPLARMMDVNLAGVEQTGSWWWLAVSGPHSGGPLDLLHSAGIAAAVVGVCLLLTRARPNLLLPLSAAGAMTLTLYSLHVWVMSVTDALPEPPEPVWLFWISAVLAAGIGIAFVRLGSRGPLEMVTHGASQLARHGSRTGK